MNDHDFNKMMLTEDPKDWIQLIFISQAKLTKKQFELVCNASDNPPVSATKLTEKFADVEWVKSFIKSAKSGTPSKAAYYLYTHDHVDANWVFDIIEKDKISDPQESGTVAYQLWFDAHVGDPK